MTIFFLYTIILVIVLAFVHWLSYSYLKSDIISRRKWSLNVCCGNTDGGGVNADIVRHYDVPRFDKLLNIYNLPYSNGQFEWVLCSHTVEHVEDPSRLDRELRRVGKNVVYILPPLWDIGATLNILEHKWIFITLKKNHRSLPKYVKLPGSETAQKLFGQFIKA